MNGTAYPVNLTIDYPEGKLSRLTTFFRALAIIPIAIILGLVSNWNLSFGTTDWVINYTAPGGFLMAAPALMILFRKKYPRWWFDWNLALARFSARVFAYFALLRDEYPSTDEEQAVHLEIAYPDAQRELNRFLPLVKWLLALPHYIVLYILILVGCFITVLAWFAILITGRYPRSWFNLVVGIYRWYLRVLSYTSLMVTDRYPPFSLRA